MKYLLDTNICIYVIKQKPAQVKNVFRQQAYGDIGISSVSVAELIVGVQKSQRPIQNQVALEQFLAPLTIVDFDYDAATVYGRLRAGLERAGTPIGSFDLLIAAHAVALDVTLVTNNEREFGRVPHLSVVNWV